MDVGGFSVDGTIQYIGNHYYKVRANYEFNDIVDPGNNIIDWIFAIGAFLIVLIENNITIALTSSAASIGNIGPAFGVIGPMGDFSCLHSSTKWILIMLMLIGRLEIIPFLAILNKDLWKN